MGMFYDAEDGEIHHFELHALKLLAAIHQHRQYQAQSANDGCRPDTADA
jgi:hypothetical protein